MDQNVGNENNIQRESWGNKIQFLMSCIAMAVGFGNVWRFPFIAYENGGGAFLIAYLIIIIAVAKPFYFFEVCLGQFSSKNNFNTFASLMPIMKGVGFGQLMIIFSATSYYGFLICIALLYFAHSFTDNLPWTYCKVEWEGDGINCIASSPNRSTSFTIVNATTSSELWLSKEVLKIKPQIEDGLGWPDWKLTGFLFLVYLISFVITVKGIKSIGVASYFLAILPYVFLFILAIRAVTLEGSSKGVLYFFTPKWESLLMAKVWYNAVTQALFSMSIGSGTLLVLSSYNDFSHDVYRDALIVSIFDTFASFLSGITIFGMLGNLSKELGVEITDVVSSGGLKLAFITYPDAIAKLNAIPWLYSILFFFTLIVLGLGSLITSQNCYLGFIKDKYAKVKTWQASLAIAVVGFLSGIIYTTPGGQYIFTLVDFYLVTFPGFVLSAVQVIVVFWCYGVRRFCCDIEFMLKRKPGIYWRTCWSIITPVVLVGILIYSMACFEVPKYDDYIFPKLAINLFWCLFGLILLQPLLWWIIYLYQNRKLGLIKAIIASCSFSSWRPAKEEDYQGWEAFKTEKLLRNEKTWMKKVQHFFITK